MTASLKTIKVEPESELGSLIKDAASTGESVFVNTGEAVYVLDVSTDTTNVEPVPNGRRPSPDQVARSIEGIRKAAGSWKDIDAEAFKAYIRGRRLTKNRPSVRW